MLIRGGGELMRRDSGDGAAADEAEAAGAEADAEEETAPDGAVARAGGSRGRSSGARLLDKARSASWRRGARKKAEPAEGPPPVSPVARPVLRVTEGAIASHDAEAKDPSAIRPAADEEDTASVEDVDWSVPPSEDVSEHNVQLQADSAT